jgi:hypothetical protein
MVAQRDYLHGESQLVPQSLLVYRHFFVSMHGEEWVQDMDGLKAMQFTKLSTPKLISMNGREASYTEGGPGPFTARCVRTNTFFGAAGVHAGVPDKRPTGEHKSPHVDCTCGFYAHYDPGTDFYPDTGWTLGGPERGSVVWDAFSQYGGSYHTVTYAEPYIMVRAVVEMSGTVVMGSKGVRAEKMKVVAMAIDWNKFVSVREVRRMEHIDVSSFFDRDPVYLPSPIVERQPVVGRPTDKDRMEAEEAVKEVASLAGAKFYTDAGQMYARHPKPDLSSLGVEPAKASPPDAWHEMVQQIRQSMQAYTQTFQTTAQEMQKLLGLINQPRTKPKRKPGGTMPDFYQRALEKKRNKPAPPGSGIDRRKKKP